MNTGVVTGNLAADPESVGKGSTVVVRLRLAVDKYDPSTRSRTAFFMRATAFGNRAENLLKYAAKGQHLELRYHLDIDEWTDSTGKKRSDLVAIVDDFDLGPSKSSGAGYAPASEEPPTSGFSF